MPPRYKPFLSLFENQNNKDPRKSLNFSKNLELRSSLLVKATNHMPAYNALKDIVYARPTTDNTEAMTQVQKRNNTNFNETNQGGVGLLSFL